MAKKTKKITKQSKRRLLLLGPISIGMVILSFYTVISCTYKQLSLKEQETNLLTQLEHLKDEEEELRNEVDKLQDPEYLARYARETYLYTKDGEYVIKIDNKNTVNIENKDFFKEYKSYILFSFLIVFILLFVIIKNIYKAKKIEVS